MFDVEQILRNPASGIVQVFEAMHEQNITGPDRVEAVTGLAIMLVAKYHDAGAQEILTDILQRLTKSEADELLANCRSASTALHSLTGESGNPPKSTDPRAEAPEGLYKHVEAADASEWGEFEVRLVSVKVPERMSSPTIGFDAPAGASVANVDLMMTPEGTHIQVTLEVPRAHVPTDVRHELRVVGLAPDFRVLLDGSWFNVGPVYTPDGTVLVYWRQLAT